MIRAIICVWSRKWVSEWKNSMQCPCSFCNTSPPPPPPSLSLSPLLYYLLDHQNVLHETKFDIFENAKYQSWHSVVWQVIHPLMKTKIWFGFCCISLDSPLSTQPLPHDSAVCEIRAHFLFSPPDNSWHILKEWLCLYATEFFYEHTVATEVFRHWSSTKMCECQYTKWQISLFKNKIKK